MAFSFTKFLKGLTVREENTTTPKEIDIVPGGSAGTKTTITTSQSTSRTITLPDATGTLITPSTTDTLTNKTIDATSNTISNLADVNIKTGAAIDASKIGTGTVSNTEFGYLDGVTSAIQTQINAKADSSALTSHTGATSGVHGVTGTIVGTSDAQTLTNKTIDADLNILTNIENADIKVGAAIDAAKIGAGTVSNTEFGYLDGVTSAIQTQINSKQDAATAATLNGIETLTNKTLTTPTIGSFVNANHNHSDAANGGQLSLTNAVTGTLPIANGGTNATSATSAFNNLSPLTTKGDIIVRDATNNVRQAIGTDGQVLVADSAQTNGLKWSNISGVKNYITNDGAESSVTGWSAYADAAGTRPVDGTGGSPTITITRSTSSPLRGVGSFLITKGAANTQGQGVSYDFTIDSADQAKVLNVSFDWAVASGTYSGGTSTTDSDLIVYIYDVTNTRMIEPAPIKMDGAVIGTNYRYVGSFQTASNSTSYRLIIHTATTSASAYTIKYDNVVVGPSTVNTGAYIGEWTSYTPAASQQGFGTISGVDAKYRRVGSNIELQVNFIAGTVVASEARFDLPPGMTINVAATKSVGEMVSTGTTAGSFSVLAAANLSYLNFGAQTGSTGGSTAANGNTVAVTGGTQRFFASVPINGLGTSQILSSETDTRVVAARYNGATGTITGTDSVVTFSNLSFDTHSAYSAGTYTVPITGKYSIKSALQLLATYALNQVSAISIYKNGVQVSNTATVAGGANTSLYVQIADDVDCVAGDLITIRANSGGTSPSINASTVRNYLSIDRISGPSQIAASETVSASYTNTAGSTFTNGNFLVADFATRTFDTHGAVTTGSGWKFTAPIAGKYSISAGLLFNIPATTRYQLNMGIRKNGVATNIQVVTVSATQNSTNGSAGIAGSFLIDMLAGDFVQLYAGQDTGADRALNTGAGANFINIHRIGN